MMLVKCKVSGLHMTKKQVVKRQHSAYFSDRGRRFKLIVDAQGCAQTRK